MNALIAELTVLAAEAGGGGGGDAPPGPGQAAGQSIWFLVLVGGVLVLFIWFSHRSQKKRQQKREDMLENLRPKDDVVTIGGIHGRIVRIEEDTVVLRVDPEKDIKITMTKSRIGRKAGEEEEDQQ